MPIVYIDLVRFNDLPETTQADVIDVFARAIKYLKSL